MGNGVLHAAGEHVGQLLFGLSLGALGGPHTALGGLHAALVFQGAHLHHVAAQGLAQLFQIDFIPVFAHQVNHVHGNHHGDAQLDELGGQVQVALDVGAVHNVQNGIGLLVYQIAPGHHLLQGVGGQGIDAGQVLDDHVLVPFQATLFFLHGDAGPVAHVLAGAGQGIEQGGFAAVRVARQRDFNFHFRSLLSC